MLVFHTAGVPYAPAGKGSCLDPYFTKVKCCTPVLLLFASRWARLCALIFPVPAFCLLFATFVVHWAVALAH